MKVLIITNIPSPYRVLQFDKVAEILGDDFCVFYCAITESNRNWINLKIKHNHLFLNKSIFKNIYLNIDILKHLKRFKPEIIISAGFSPTIIISFFYTLFNNKKFIVFTDFWLHSVNKHSKINRIIRKLIIPRASASICIGYKGKEFLIEYGAREQSIFRSPISIDNKYYLYHKVDINKREYDLMFSGRFVDEKFPQFTIDILKSLKQKKIDFKFIIIGSGEKKDEIINQLELYSIDYYYPGFIQQKELPKFYSNAKLLLFPTKQDAWGVVANEACAVGTPVITCENAGVANDLIINEKNGYVLPLDVDIWVNKIITLLNDERKLNQFSKNCTKKVKKYSVELAAQGIIDAVDYVINPYEK